MAEEDISVPKEFSARRVTIIRTIRYAVKYCRVSASGMIGHVWLETGASAFTVRYSENVI